MKGFNWKKITKQSEFYVFLIIVVLSVIIQIRSGLFFANNNIVDIMRSMIVPCIYALCAFLAFISTGPDVFVPSDRCTEQLPCNYYYIQNRI